MPSDDEETATAICLCLVEGTRGVVGESAAATIDLAQWSRLCAHLRASRIAEIDVHDDDDDANSHAAAAAAAASSFCVYLSAACSDYRLLQERLAGLARAMSTARRIVLVEDLVYVQRPYVLESAERAFFRTVRRSLPEIEIVSSQELMNRWGEGDVRVVVLDAAAHPAAFPWPGGPWPAAGPMYNQGSPVPRLVAVQSLLSARGGSDGEEAEEAEGLGRPLYRHPFDEEPPNTDMCPEVRALLAEVEKATGVSGLNHVLIQVYRDGSDNIARHSDKTLDMDRNTPIVNVSLGCTRVMRIQHKRDRRRTEIIPLRHGECVVFGLETNRHWYHEVPKDVTLVPHPVFGTVRISFTFRRIATFTLPDSPLDVPLGQGSPFRSLAQYEEAKAKANLPPRTAHSDLVAAFSRENRQSDDFDWEVTYGAGFW